MGAVTFGGACTTSPEGFLNIATETIVYGDLQGWEKLVDWHEEIYGKPPGACIFSGVNRARN